MITLTPRRAVIGCLALGVVFLLPGAAGSAPATWLDPSFGRNGVLRPVFGEYEDPAGVAVQPDGRIVLAATSRLSGSRSNFVVARYLRAGKPDSSFGVAGKVVVDIGPNTFDEAAALALQPDGKIVVAGWTHDGHKRNLALVRLDSDGSLDGGFGVGGAVTTDVGAAVFVADLAVQPDGKLVVAGSRENARGDGEILVARYAADGTLDPAFDHDGWRATPLRTKASAGASSVAVQSDGSIVVGGAGGFIGEPGISSFDAAFVRFRPDGDLDTSFGDGGQVLIGLSANDWVADVLLRADGRTIAAATASGGIASPTSRFALLRLTRDGSLDESFGRGGKVLTGFTSKPRDTADVLVRGSAGTLVVAGGHRGSGDDQSNFALARYRSNGALDKTFGRGGRLLTDLGSDEEIVGLALQSDRKLVALGSRSRGGGVFSGITLARYLPRLVCVVPDVRGRSVSHARRALDLAGCRVGQVKRRRSKGRAGIVLAQRPRAGATLPRGGKVTLVVSRS